MAAVSHEWHGDVVVATLDNPPVNASTHEMRSGVGEVLRAAQHGGAVGLVLIGARQTWISGSDLAEFTAPAVPQPLLTEVIEQIEEAAFTVVAALDGYALGGGLELALACDHRIGTARLVVGLPEVSLGIVPGAGGTQRLPRLVGRATALEVIAGHRRMGGIEAAELGVLDRIAAPHDLLDVAVDSARSQGKNRLRERTVPPDGDRLDGVIAAVRRRGRRRPQVEEAIRLVTMAGTVPVDEALTDERATFDRLRLSPESAALRHLFFASREAGRGPVRVDWTPRAVGVLGAGGMGRGISAAVAATGVPVVAVDSDPRALDVARSATHPSGVTFSADLDDLSHCDLVIEAVFEDPEVKTEALARLEETVAETCIITTNTSYLDLDLLASGFRRPERFVGLHFFAPAERMRLVEVVVPVTADDRTVAAASAFVRGLGKQAVLTGTGEGFVGNRILQAYRRHAEYLLEDGCRPEEVDRALETFGFAMGPFTVADLSGLHVARSLRERRRAEGRAPARDVRVPDLLCDQGRMGRNCGRGYYAYVDGRRQPDPEVARIIDEVSNRGGPGHLRSSEEEIVRRCVGAMVIESARVVLDGTARRPGDVDVAAVEGLGFPRHHGGPLWWAASALTTDELEIVMGAVETAETVPMTDTREVRSVVERLR